MLGAIFGDIVGSHYEFDPTKNYDFQLLHEDSRPTDDTVMTLAVAKALMDTYGEDDDTIRRAVIKEMQRLGRKYHNAGYGGSFYHWLDKHDPDDWLRREQLLPCEPIRLHCDRCYCPGFRQS